MSTMRIAAIFAALMFLTVPAWADWMVGDPYKMHAPQLPDPTGWDVSFSPGLLGDDWLCTGSGVVDDIHLWVSLRGDNGPLPVDPFFDVSGPVEIWSNVPAGIDGDFSHPGGPLWSMYLTPGMPNVKILPYGVGEQGWLDPLSGEFVPLDHTNYYQINIDPARGPDGTQFVQQEGETYWLMANLTAFHKELPVVLPIGWKTSLTQYFDDAVYQSPFFPGWVPLEDPMSPFPRSLDLAFVITPVPEPATVVLLMLGAGLLTIQRRRH